MLELLLITEIASLNLLTHSALQSGEPMSRFGYQRVVTCQGPRIIVLPITFSCTTGRSTSVSWRLSAGQFHFHSSTMKKNKKDAERKLNEGKIKKKAGNERT
jgi:hypothetical protein